MKRSYVPLLAMLAIAGDVHAQAARGAIHGSVLDSATAAPIPVAAVHIEELHRLEVAAFIMDLDDYIFPSSRGRAEAGTVGGARLQFTNEDARFLGFEGEFELPIAGRWALHGTASHVAARFTEARDSIPVFEGADTTFIAASKYPPLIPPVNGQLELRYEHERFFGGAGVRFSARQERLGDFETPTDGYVLANTDVGYRFLPGERLHSITLRVDNLFDTEYRDHLSRIKEIMPEPGVNLTLLYRLTF